MMYLLKNTIAPIFTLIYIITLLPLSNAEAQQKSIFDLMNYEEVLEMTIETDFDSLNNSRRTDDYQKAFLSFKDENKQLQNWEMKVRTRGKFRRQLCEMPPLKLKFNKSELAAAGLSEFNDMKLVTHCVADKTEAKELLLKEYLTYQLYAELTPNSYRTQLVRITYKDVKTGEKTKNWGFLIEDTAQLAARLAAETCDCWGNQESDFEHGTTDLVAMFQYMIGNEDYRLASLKNVKTLRRGNLLVPVAYDFDFSGLVNASYAIPNVDYRLNKVTDRVYLGSSKSLDRLHSATALFYTKERRLKKIIEDFKLLKGEQKEEMVAYLDIFFQNIEDIQPFENEPQVTQRSVVAK